MTPTEDFYNQVVSRVRVAMQTLRPLLLKGYGSIEHQLKDDKSVVTEMDLLVERRLQTILAGIDPSIGFGGEETGVDYNQKTFFLVDPIDGTESFIRGLPFSTTMVTLIDNNEPVLAIIYNFFLDEYYLAIKGAGATMNGHPIRVSNRPLDRAYIMLGADVSQPSVADLNGKLRTIVKGMPKMLSSGFEHSAVARGSIDGTVILRPKGHPWDYAPGALLIREAGGRVENLDSSGYDYRNTQFIAANPVIFDQLKQFMRDNRTV